MNLKPGCGCAVLVLGVINLLVAVTLLWGMATNPGNLGLSSLMLGVFIANIVVCFMLGLPAIRRRGREAPESAMGEETEGGADVEDDDQ